MSPESRAEYFKERRKATKTFYVEVPSEKMDKLQKKLSDAHKTKKEWLCEKIDEELSK